MDWIGSKGRRGIGTIEGAVLYGVFDSAGLGTVAEKSEGDSQIGR